MADDTMISQGALGGGSAQKPGAAPAFGKSNNRLIKLNSMHQLEQLRDR